MYFSIKTSSADECLNVVHFQVATLFLTF